MKRKIVLRKILENFCSPQTLRKYDLLSEKNIGSATHFGLRLTLAYFDKKNGRKLPEDDNNDWENKPRVIKINSRNGTEYRTL